MAGGVQHVHVEAVDVEHRAVGGELVREPRREAQHGHTQHAGDLAGAVAVVGVVVGEQHRHRREVAGKAHPHQRLQVVVVGHAGIDDEG